MVSLNDFLRAELERLFDLDEMKRLSTKLLGLDPEEVGGTSSKGSFARSLVERCINDDALQALGDAMVLSSSGRADDRLKNVLSIAPDGEIAPGTAVGSARILKKLGEGGLGVVYLAEPEPDAEADRSDAGKADAARVAVKVFRPQFARDRSAVQRFKTASRVMQSLSGNSLARVVDVGETEDARPWVAQPYLNGQTLAARIKQTGCMHFNEARPVFCDVLEALRTLHEHGMVHGNVKTENVFIIRETRPDGTRGEARGMLVDPCATRLLSPATIDVHSSGLFSVLGTAKAIAPEQARGAELDPRSDIYAMGVLMYETVAGRPPFEGESTIDVIAQHLSAVPESPSSYARRGWVSPEIDELILHALAKEPAARFQSTQELLEAVQDAGEPVRRKVPLDQVAFDKLAEALLTDPENEQRANELEELARQSGSWDELLKALEQTLQAAQEGVTKLSLLFRVARICETDAEDVPRAEEAYRRVLELDPENRVATSGIESCKRAGGDSQGLLDLLLDRMERESSAEARAAILREVAALYEDKLQDSDNAFTAWLQVLTEQPGDEKAAEAIERLAGYSQERWVEALGTLSEKSGTLYAQVFPDADSEQMAEQIKLHELAARKEEIAQQQAAAQQALEAENHNISVLEQQLQEAKRRGEELNSLVSERNNLAEQARQAAEQAVERYEQMAPKGEEGEEGEEGEMPEQLPPEVEAVAEEASQLVEAADLADEQAQKAAQEAAEVWEQVKELEAGLEQSRQSAAAAEQAAARANEAAEEIAIDEELQPEEPDEDWKAEQRERDMADLVRLYVLMGGWYAGQLNRPDFALPCFSQALAIDPVNEEAYDGTIDLYRVSQSWSELAAVLIQRAENTVNPLQARDFRAEAAAIIAEKLNDPETALAHFQLVLQEDPAHPQANEVAENIYVERNNFPALVELLEKRAEVADDDRGAELLNVIAELYEDRLDDLESAEAAYEKAVKLEPRNLTALKGLERIYARNNNYPALLENLRTQVELSPTPKQRIALLERIGLLLEEEFVDYAAAAESFEKVIKTDPGHEGANTALVRLYRHLQRFDDMVDTLDRHARATDDRARKVELLLQSVQLLMGELEAPDRAIVVCERILAINPEQPEALDLVARLKSTVGDVPAAIEAMERLAEHETDPVRQSGYFTRVGVLLEQVGDEEGAVARYRKALDLDNTATDAADALRRIYQQRGDYRGTVEMLRHEIEIADGNRRKAELLALLGTLYRDKLGEDESSREVFELALELDGTCTEAAVGLGRMYFEQDKYEEAAEHFESVLGRVDEMRPAEASTLCLLAGETFQKLGKTDAARDVYKRARDFSPDDLEINERLASLLMQLGDARDAERLYDRIYKKFGEDLPESGQARLLLALGEAQLASKQAKRAIDTFKGACELQPEDPALLEALTRAYEAANEWNEVVALLQLRSRLAIKKGEAFKLYVQTGDVFLEKLRDRRAAAQTYVTALELEPNNRNLLTKLMAVYSDTQDWSRLIEVILRIAEMVDDTTQLAKYYNTAATIAHHELGRFDEAANYYEEALANDPASDAAFNGLVECLTQNQDWERLRNAYETLIGRVHDTAPKAKTVQMMDALGEILQHRLGRLEDAIAVYEQAQQLDPDNRNRKEMLTEIYTREPKRFFQQSVRVHRELLDADPYRVDSYRAMRKAYTKVKRPDESWCICQVLNYLNMSGPDEEKFYRKYRLSQLPKVKNPISEESWRDLLVHPMQQPELTAIFAYILPAVVASQGQPLAAFGVTPELRTIPANDQTAMGRMLDHVAGAARMYLPEVYHRPQDPGGLSFLFSSPPAIGIGEGARANAPQQALAFVAGRHLSYFRPGHFIRQMVPTGTGLRAWMMAAIRMVAPKFPVPATLEPQVKSCTAAIKQHLTGPQRDTLLSMTQKLLQSAPELDMKRWVTGVDLTADRIGFTMSNDLKLASAVIEASPEGASALPGKDRVRELLRYGVSEQYFELRHRLGIALGR